MNVALVIIAFFFVVAVMLGLYARRGRAMSLEQWSLGGRGFGTIFVFLLMAGEIYTTFTFLGGSGWAYGKGAPAFYILGYMLIAYSMSYFLLPAIWRYAKKHQLVSQADFFIRKYDSSALGILVAIVSVAACVPYLVLQLKGLGIIVSEASYGSIAPTAAIWTGGVALVAFVVASGVRGSAWTAVLKDIMILAAAVFAGIYLPLHYYGSLGAMFTEIEKVKPQFFVLPSSGMSPSWFISTVVLSGLGFFMWPHAFATIYTARGEQVFRRNAVLMPIYQLILVFVFLAGFAAVLKVPGLQGADADLSLLRISKVTFSPWLVGMMGAAGVLTALVPGSMLLVTSTTILAQNIYRPIASPNVDDRRVSIVARSAVPAVALLAVVLTLRGGSALVPLLLMGYSMVTQLMPSLVLSLGERPLISAGAAFAGILAGELVVAYMTISGATLPQLIPSAPQVIKDLNVGVVALVVNVTVLAVVSLLTTRPRTVLDAEPATS
ncbi:MAG: sodium:solute symporter [Gemmatimonadaceae bacterium]